MNGYWEGLVNKLYRCRYLPGTWDKRFIHTLHAKPTKDLETDDLKLTEKQVAELKRIAWRMRMQLRQLGFDPPLDFKPEQDNDTVSLVDREKLKAWTEAVKGETHEQIS
jgi:hypothetical protein